MYRAEIQALENDLYHEPFDARMREATAIKLGDLADKVAQEDGAMVMLFSIEMRQLGGYARMGKDANFVRGNWERIRVGVFVDAVWYRWRHSPQRPQVASHIGLGGNNDLRREYLRILVKLDEMVVRGKRDVERMGEPEERTTTYARGDYQDLVEDWDDWADDWHRKLSWLENDLPDQPEYTEDAAMRFAHQNLANAIRELDTVPRGTGSWKTPFRNQWESRFSRAEAQLDKARFQIDK